MSRLRDKPAAAVFFPSRLLLPSGGAMDRRSAIKHVVGALGAAKLWDADASAGPQPAQGAHRIQTSKITAYLNKQGEITGVELTPEPGKQIAGNVLGKTVLAGCEVKKVSSKRLTDGAFEFTKDLIQTAGAMAAGSRNAFFREKTAACDGKSKFKATGRPGALPLRRISLGPQPQRQSFGQPGATAGPRMLRIGSIR